MSGGGHDSFSPIWSQESCQAVTQSDGKAAGVDLFQRDLARGLSFHVDEVVQPLGQILVEALHIELKVKPQAARIPVR